MANNAYDRLPDDYGVFKQFCSNNHYVSLAKTLSSAVSTRDTAATMKRITHASNTYGHMGQLLIRDGRVLRQLPSEQRFGRREPFQYDKRGSAGCISARTRAGRGF